MAGLVGVGFKGCIDCEPCFRFPLSIVGFFLALAFLQRERAPARELVGDDRPPGRRGKARLLGGASREGGWGASWECDWECEVPLQD